MTIYFFTCMIKTKFEKKFNIKKEDFLIGSFQRDSEGKKS